MSIKRVIGVSTIPRSVGPCRGVPLSFLGTIFAFCNCHTNTNGTRLAIANNVPLQPTCLSLVIPLAWCLRFATCMPVCLVRRLRFATHVPFSGVALICIWHEPCNTHAFLFPLLLPAIFLSIPSLTFFLPFGCAPLSFCISVALFFCLRFRREISVSGPASLAGFRYIGPLTRVRCGLAGCPF